MSTAIVIRAYGGSEVLTAEQVDLPDPPSGELRIRQTAVGVNYHDVYVRSGLYKTLSLPGIPGCEAAGVIEAVGAGVVAFEPGDRVGYVTGEYGAYASHRNLSTDLAVRLPGAVSDEVVASNLLRAMTVEMLTTQVCRLEPGMTILVHAAAGGVGRLLCQWASRRDVTVIGTVGSAEKARSAVDNGCAHPVLYREVDFAAAVANITGGAGVDVVFDSVGADTFSGSIAVLKRCGHLVNFGQSSGAAEPVAMSTLAAKSLSISRPILFHYLQDPAQYRAMAGRVLDDFQAGVLRAPPAVPVALEDAALAHDRLESLSGGGALVLIP